MPLEFDNLNIAPYYDTTIEELEKGYSKYLALEGQVLQNRELNISQGLIQGNVRKITDLIIDDGSVVSGCNFINNSETNICTLESGEIYFNGLLIKVPRTEWSYAQVPLGMCYVCLEISQNVYTESDDPSLYDPAENIENTGNRGGHRLKYEATPIIKTVSEYETETSTNKNLIAIIKLKDRNTYGPIKPKPIFSKIYNQMAERTYDSDGDFIANGLRVYTHESDYPEYKYNIRVSKGRVYVKGYNYTYEKDQYILEDLALTTRSNEGIPETKTFITGQTSYELNKQFINSIIDVNSFIKISNVDMTGYSHNVITALEDSPYNLSSDKISVSSVIVDGYSSSDYTFNFETNVIGWNIEPVPSEYTINIDLVADLTENEDYFITKDHENSIINFKNTSTVRDDTQTFSVTYSWFLPRYDLVYIKEDGYINVKNGIPNELELIKPPNIPIGCLPLVYIKVEPGKIPSKFEIDSFDIYRVPTIQVQTMKRKLNDIEYNFAMTELEQISQNKHLESDDLYKLKNIFADAITGYDKLDINNKLFDSTVDIFKSEARLPMVINHISYDLINFKNSSGESINNELLRLDIDSDKVADFQPYITHNIDIAPHYYKGLIPKIVCDPKKLKYIKDSETSKIIWLPNRVIYSSRIVNRWRTVTVNDSSPSGTRINTWERKDSDIIGSEVVETKKKEINLTPDPYIKPGSVLEISGEDFPANSEIRLYLDDKIITNQFTDPVYTDVEDVDIETLEFTYTTYSWRPWTWRWRRHWWNGGWHWRFWHPYYYGPSKKSFALYYNDSSNSWYWEKVGFGVEIDGTGSLTSIPGWVKWIRRAPWWRYYWNQLVSTEHKDLVEYINSKETITEVDYPDDYEEANITVITDWDGHFKIEIKIPENIPTGKHTITAETVLPENFNPDRYFSAQDEFTGESYTRHWVNEIHMRKIERVVETIYVQRTVTRSTGGSGDGSARGGGGRGGNDPIAQSFSFSDDQFLTGIDLYFSHKSTTEENPKAWFNIREMVNGYPTGPIIYYKDISIDDINIPSPTELFPVTHLDFDYPIYCEAKKEYAFSLGSNVDGIRLFYAKMGNRDLITNEPVIYQPHPSGVMFTSSNNNTWTPIQDSDLTYVLYRADFDNTSNKEYYIYYVNENCDNHSNDFKIMNISIGDVILENTEIKYEYTITDTDPLLFDPTTENWKELNIEEMYAVDTSENMKLYIRATLSSADSKVTPIINPQTFDAFFAKYKTLGSYILIPLNIE